MVIRKEKSVQREPENWEYKDDSKLIFNLVFYMLLRRNSFTSKSIKK